MKVSIITVAYNSAKTLSDTIRSVLGQTYSDIEYWIIDGNSNDGTQNIIRQYEKHFNGRMRWISEPDCGIYDAMNKGISLCSGDIIGFLNADDFFTSDHAVAHIAKHFTDDTDAIYGDVHFVKDRQLDKCVRYYSGAIFRPWMVKFGFIPPHPSFYVRKKIYEKYGAYRADYQISADFELIARVCYKNKIRISYTPLDVVTMRLGGVSTNCYRNHLLGLIETLRACKNLGIHTNLLFVSMKYIIKLYGLIRT